MTCFSPIQAGKDKHGEMTWNHHIQQTTFEIPCGQCIGCRLETARQWAGRCDNEASMHKLNIFLTLTYNDNNLPKGNTLVKRDLQLFIKRLRKHHGTNNPIRYYACGEYGEHTGRPHYHAIIFGYSPTDQKFHTINERGEKLFTSEELDQIWGLGKTIHGAVTFESAGYCARYTTKKAYGKDAQWHYIRIDEEQNPYWLLPEFSIMSLKPAIGRGWFLKYTNDITKHDQWIVNGKISKPPRYYDKLHKILDPERAEQQIEDRKQESKKHQANNTTDRLKVREEVKHAQLKNLRKKL